mgnify:CR=1 FL=1
MKKIVALLLVFMLILPTVGVMAEMGKNLNLTFLPLKKTTEFLCL